jgi:hypothetical protein
LSFDDKRALLSKNKKCFNCLRQGHSASDCRTRFNCYYYLRRRQEGDTLPSKHITYVCFEKYKKESKTGGQSDYLKSRRQSRELRSNRRSPPRRSPSPDRRPLRKTAPRSSKRSPNPRLQRRDERDRRTRAKTQVPAIQSGESHSDERR